MRARWWPGADVVEAPGTRPAERAAGSRPRLRIGGSYLDGRAAVISSSPIRAIHAPFTGSGANGTPCLVCKSSGPQKRYVMGKDPITIGRSPDCDIQIKTDFVSRQHARLVRKDTTTIIEDQSSMNGIFVNGQRVASKQLADRDEIRIGGMHFIFHAGDPRT